MSTFYFRIFIANIDQTKLHSKTCQLCLKGPQKINMNSSNFLLSSRPIENFVCIHLEIFETQLLQTLETFVKTEVF